MARKFSMALGTVLLLVGLCGIATGGHDHNLVVFGVNAGHNTLHVVSGIAALLAAMAGERAAMIYCLVFGTAYGGVAVLGFFNVAYAMSALNLNRADDFLHLAISALCLWVGGRSKGS